MTGRHLAGTNPAPDEHLLSSPPTESRAAESRGGNRTRPADLLVRNSALLIATTCATAVLGFTFWVVAARFFSAADVGVASTLWSGLSLLAYVSLAGLNSTLIRHLGTGELMRTQISQSLLGVGVVSLILGAAYVTLAPVLAPKLDVLREPLAAGIFVAAAVLAAVNLLTDSIFVGLRSAGYNLAIDGLLQSGVKLLSLLLLIGTGAVGIFGASTLALLIATVASLAALVVRFGYRWRLGRHLAFNRQQAFFSFGSYVSSCLHTAPLLLVPLIVLHFHGAEQSAYYFTAFQLALMLYTFANAVGESNFSESRAHPKRAAELRRRAARLNALIVVPGTLGLLAVGPFILQAFGSTYATEGRSLLMVLALAAIPQSFYAWAGFLNRIAGHVRAMIAADVTYFVVVVGLAYYWSNESLAHVGWAWFLGNAAAGGVAFAGWYRHQRRSTAHPETAHLEPRSGTEVDAR
ncbi:MAG: lipopolysaccharide biosynthesis protein [Actinomycetales bacterium]